jgi:hypothetical protein
MSDDPFPDDELVSAVLDGEATAEEAARVGSDPALTARLEELRSLAERVGTPRMLVSSARDEHIARAVAEADNWGSSPVAPPIDLGEARRRRRRTTTIVSIAAVIGLLLVGLSIARVVGRDDQPGTDVASVAPTSEELADDSGAERATADEDTSEGAAVESVAPESADAASGVDAEASFAEALIDLGSFTNRTDLQAALTVAVDQYLADESGFNASGSFTPGVSAQVGSGSPRADCEATIANGDDEAEALLWSADAELEGVPLYLFLYATDPSSAANGRLRLYAVDQTICEPIENGVQTFSP